MDQNPQKAVRVLVEEIEAFLKNIDRAMNEPSNNERGRMIAMFCNALEMQKDIAKRFVLGMSLELPARSQKLKRTGTKV